MPRCFSGALTLQQHNLCCCCCCCVAVAVLRLCPSGRLQQSNRKRKERECVFYHPRKWPDLFLDSLFIVRNGLKKIRYTQTRLGDMAHNMIFFGWLSINSLIFIWFFKEHRLRSSGHFFDGQLLLFIFCGLQGNKRSGQKVLKKMCLFASVGKTFGSGLETHCGPRRLGRRIFSWLTRKEKKNTTFQLEGGKAFWRICFYTPKYKKAAQVFVSRFCALFAALLDSFFFLPFWWRQ